MKKELFKGICLIMLLLVTLFSFSIKSNAASFAYEDFNWDEFAKQNKNYWVSRCSEDDDECVDVVLATKERFYTRLYQLLSEVKKKYGTVIDDNIIIATVFYGLDGESFQDPSDDEYSPYNLDDSSDSATKDSYIGNVDESATNYFLNETDSLKTLINSFIGYNFTCLALTNEVPQEYKNSDGTSSWSCPTNEYIVSDGSCLAEVDNYKGNFWDILNISFLGNDNISECQTKVKELGLEYYGLKASAKQEVREEYFWDFLENESYLDNKQHLSDYYGSILSSVNKESMKDLTLDEKEKYKEEIIKVRQRIIKGIKEVVSYYEGVSSQYNVVSQNKYWWPIGSDSTIDVDGVVFASDTPSKITISSPFGLRVDPVTGERNTSHNGIDVPGDLGVTNVISVKDGVISKITNECSDGANADCGGGYGNYIMIQHVDGNYTLYAHLASGSISLNVGDSVKQGQVIGKVGNSGKSTGPHLHFEIRVGGNDISLVQDPLSFVSAENPRASGTSNDILEWIGAMEGTGPVQGDNYQVYADSGGVLTVGHGITLIYNADQFRAHGIEPKNLSVGSLVPKNIVDSIYEEDINARFDNIKALLSQSNITLSENQIAALASLQFNCGNINGFIENYQTYGVSQSLCSNWWEQKALHDASGNYLKGLKNRRIKECNLFVNNKFD